MKSENRFAAPVGGRAGGMRGLVRGVLSALARLAVLAAPPFLRIALAAPFFKSGLTRWDGFAVSETTLFLFQYEFKIHLPGAAFAFPFPTLMAYVTASAEIVLPILLVAGLATRFAALAVLAMTVVIELVYPDAWVVHASWAAMALALIALGPGPLSLDRLIDRR